MIKNKKAINYPIVHMAAIWYSLPIFWKHDMKDMARLTLTSDADQEHI